MKRKQNPPEFHPQSESKPLRGGERKCEFAALLFRFPPNHLPMHSAPTDGTGRDRPTEAPMPPSRRLLPPRLCCSADPMYVGMYARSVVLYLPRWARHVITRSSHSDTPSRLVGPAAAWLHKHGHGYTRSIRQATGYRLQAFV